MIAFGKVIEQKIVGIKKNWLHLKFTRIKKFDYIEHLKDNWN